MVVKIVETALPHVEKQLTNARSIKGAVRLHHNPPDQQQTYIESDTVNLDAVQIVSEF